MLVELMFGVAVVAIVLQTVVLYAMFQASRQMRDQIGPALADLRAMRERVNALADRAEPALESAQGLLTEMRQSAAEFSLKAADMMDLSRKQLVRVDDLLGEAAVRTRVQMDRIELVLDDVVNRFQETTALVQKGIVRPIRQLNGVTAGVRAALSALGRRRTSVEQATHDEEMFI